MFVYCSSLIRVKHVKLCTQRLCSTSSVAVDRAKILDRDWRIVENYWSSIISSDSPLPKFINDPDNHDDEYSRIVNLKKISEVGKLSEFNNKDYRYTSRYTYAMRIGYNGLKYRGYQRQRGVDIQTVENDLSNILKVATYCAGRTDADVSAISQVVSFITSNVTITPDEIKDKINNVYSDLDRRLKCYDVYRVPKSFNPRSHATWRRYIYMVPLNKNANNSCYDIDINFVNKMLSKVENLELNYHAFSHGEDRSAASPDGLQDRCVMFKAKSYYLNLEPNDVPVLTIELVANRFLRKMVRIICGTIVREALKDENKRNDYILLDICSSGERRLAGPPLPGSGLCLAGVGYDERELAFYKFISKKERARIEEIYKNKLVANCK